MGGLRADAMEGFGSLVFAQIRFLVVNLNKKNQKSSSQELAQLLGLYGEAAFVFLLRCLLEEIDFRDTKLQKDSLKVQLLAINLAKLSAQPNFAHLAVEVFGAATLLPSVQEEFLHTVMRGVKANMAQQLSLGLGLCQAPDEQLSSEAEKFLRTKLGELGKETAAALPQDLMHSLLFFVQQHDGFSKQRATLVKLLQQLYSEATVPIALLPLLYGQDHDANDLNSRLSYEVESVNVSASPVRPALLSATGTELADLMQDLGYSCCASAKCVYEIFSQFEGINDASIAAVVGMMMRTVSSLDDSLSLHSAFSIAISGKYLEFDAKFDADKDDHDKALTAWNLDAFIDAVNDLPQVSWRRVFGLLDTPTLGDAVGADGLALAVTLHRHACHGAPLSAGALLGEWTNIAAQLSLLTHALASPTSLSWEGVRTLEPPPEVTMRPELNCWLALGLTRTLLRIADAGYYNEVLALFAKPLQASPQLLLTALLNMAPAGSAPETPLQQDLLEQLFPLFISGDSPGSTALLLRLWPLQPAAIMRAMAQLHRAQPQSILRLLDLAQSCNALEQVLRLSAYSFTIDLATLAQRKDLIEVEPWLVECLRRDKEHAFLKAVLDYLRDKLLGPSARSAVASSATNLNVLSLDTAAVFFRVLHAAPNLPNSLADDVTQLYLQCVQAKPKLQTLYGGPTGSKAAAAIPPAAVAAPAAAAPVGAPAPPASPAAAALHTPAEAAPAGIGGVGGVPAAARVTFPPDVEEEANGHFRRIYDDSLSIDAAVAMLKRLQRSNDKGERQVYMCMVHNLLEEYRFFPKFPDKALHTTAVLFGSLVQHGLVTNITLVTVLRGVLEAIKKPPGSAMSRFGVTALEQFRDCLPDWQQYCQLLIAIPHFAQVAPALHALVESVFAARSGGKESGTESGAAAGGGCGAIGSGVGAIGAVGPASCGAPAASPAAACCPPGALFASAAEGRNGGADEASACSGLAASLGAQCSPPLPGLSGVAALGGASNGSHGVHNGGGAAPQPPAPPHTAPGPTSQQRASCVGSPPGALSRGAPALTHSQSAQLPPTPTQQQSQPSLPALCASPASAGHAPPHVGHAASFGGCSPSPAPPGVCARQTSSSGPPPVSSQFSSELPAAAMSALGGVSGFGTQPCIETLMTAAGGQEIVPPPDTVQDKIGFLLNNMSSSNVNHKSEELQELLESHAGSMQWFAHYLVVRRVALEPNFHSLYTAMVDALGLRVLNRAVLASTLQNARVLLASPKIRSSSSERSLLKNLGSWLGQITLGRNKPLLMRDIDLKELICDAYERGLLIAVVPFAAKVLDACANSRVFLPPNPWVMALMSLLMELYQVPDLKLNLKFEIEVLAKTLKVELADLKPTTKLVHRQQDRTQTCDFANRAGASAVLGTNMAGGFGANLAGVPASACAGFGVPDGLNAMQGADPMGLRQTFSGAHGPPPPPPPPGQPGASVGYSAADKTAAMLAAQQMQQHHHAQQAQQAAQQAQMQQQQQQQTHCGSGIGATPPPPPSSSLQPQLPSERAGGVEGMHEPTVIPNLASYVHVNASLALFTQQPHLKRVVPLALDRAIREIISPVVERSVTISCVTTRELMLKDFAMEPDEMRMRKAAQLMVQNLAGSLASVTCKEPLRVACGNHLRVLLQQAGVDSSLVEQVVQLCSADNMDLGCTLIEKAATEKALRDIEEALAPAFAIRRKHREQTGSPYYDMSIFTSGRYPASLPEALRPKAGGLLPAQRRVYDDFGRIARAPALVQSGSQQPQQGGYGSGNTQQAQMLAHSLLSQQQQQQQQQQQALDGYTRSAQQTTPPLRGPQASLPGLTTSDSHAQHGSHKLPSQMSSLVQHLSSFGGQQPSASGSLFGVSGQPALSGAQETFTLPQALDRLALLMAKLDMHAGQLAAGGAATLQSLPPEHEVLALLRQAAALALACANREEAAIAMAQKVFKRMFEQIAATGAAGRLHTQLNVQLLSRLHAACPKVGRFVLEYLMHTDDEHKYNEEVVLLLLHAQVIQMSELSSHLAKQMDGGRNAAAVAFSAWLVRRCLVDEPVVSAADCADMLQVLSKLVQQRAPTEGPQRLLDDVRAVLAAGAKPRPAAPQSAQHAPPPVDGELDAAGLRAREQVLPLWLEWLGIYQQQNQSDKAYAAYLNTLHQNGWMRHNERGEHFLRISCHAALSAATDAATTDAAAKPAIAFAPLDAFSKLILLLIKSVPAETADGARPKVQLQLLTRVLSVTIHHLIRQHQAMQYEQRPHAFNQRAYLRLFGSWLFDLNAPDPALDAIQPQILYAFCSAFNALKPSRLPGFAFAWLELVSHRMFMPKLLLLKGHKGWPLLQQLLVNGLFAFLQPFLAAAELSPPVRVLYRGALRVLLVLLHDFPEFLCDYHFFFCDAIPPSCIQMRNLILSAFPRNMRLPDPFTPNLKVDLLPEIAQPPRILAPFSNALARNGFLHELDAFLTNHSPYSFLRELRGHVQNADGTHKAGVISALVLHVGAHAIGSMQSTHAASAGLAHSAHMEIYQQLTADLNAEGRYLFLNAIANQLRYPNNQTHYFSCVLLYLFSEAADERVQEQITRVLVERLIVHRPHPWGLLITFIELIKNPRYSFWSKTFTRCAPEIERLFESVARSCMAPGGAPGAADAHHADAAAQ